MYFCHSGMVSLPCIVKQISDDVYVIFYFYISFLHVFTLVCGGGGCLPFTCAFMGLHGTWYARGGSEHPNPILPAKWLMFFSLAGGGTIWSYPWTTPFSPITTIQTDRSKISNSANIRKLILILYL